MRASRGYLLLALAAPLLLTGCSAARLAYNNADWLLRREITKFTCATEEQQAWLRPRIASLHRWHRRQELPRYARTLRRLAAGLDRPLTRAWLNQVYDEVGAAALRFARRVKRPTVAYMDGLAPGQVGCMAGKMSKRWVKNQAQFDKPHRVYLERQREKWEDRLDDWTGDFTPAQRRELDRLLTARKPTHRQMHTAWRNTGLRMLALLISKDTSENRQRRLGKLMTDRYALYTPKERRMARRYERANRALSWAIASRMTAAQRSQLKQRMLGLVRDLEILAGD